MKQIRERMHLAFILFSKLFQHFAAGQQHDFPPIPVQGTGFIPAMDRRQKVGIDENRAADTLKAAGGQFFFFFCQVHRNQ